MFGQIIKRILGKSSKKDFAEQFAKYMAGGALYFWVGYAVFAICYSGLHWSWLPSKVLADAIGWSLNYIVQRFWAFKDQIHLSEMQHAGRYLFIESIGFVMDYLMIWGLKAIGVTPYIGFFVSSGFFTVWSFLWYKYWVFPEKSQPQEKDIKHHFAGVFLITEDGNGKIVGQQRDDKPGIDNPGKVGAFGGTVEAGETPRRCAWRELTQEETNLKIKETDFKLLTKDIAWRKLTKEWEVRHFYTASISQKQLDKLEVYEGQGWAFIDGEHDPDLIDSWRPIVGTLLKKLKQ